MQNTLKEWEAWASGFAEIIELCKQEFLKSEGCNNYVGIDYLREVIEIEPDGYAGTNREYCFSLKDGCFHTYLDHWDAFNFTANHIYQNVVLSDNEMISFISEKKDALKKELNEEEQQRLETAYTKIVGMLTTLSAENKPTEARKDSETKPKKRRIGDFFKSMKQNGKMKLAIIFNEKPEQWGFRGDPYFWAYLKESAEKMDLISPEELEEWIKAEYLSLSGKELTDEYMDFAIIEQFAHGGMSSGGVDNQWWTEKGIPLLKSRLSALRQTGGDHSDELRR